MADREDVAADALSSTSFYIGIPTQQFRTVQGQLADQIGTLLRIPVCRKLRRNKGPKFEPLFGGATVYSAVFGFWAEGSRRVDDHSEVIEFFFERSDFGPVVLLAISELALPALFCAQQDEVALVIRHAGRTSHLDLSCRREDQEIPESRPGPGGSPGRGGALEGRRIFEGRPASDSMLEKEEGPSIHPLRWLSILLARVRILEEKPTTSGHRLSSLDALRDSWDSWTTKHLLSADGLPRPWFGKTDPLRNEPIPEPRELNLPTIEHRVLVLAAVHWLVFGASRALKACARPPDQLWSRETATRLLRRLSSELRRIDDLWLPERYPYPEVQTVGPEFSDPFPNAVLWLAFLHDFLLFNVQAASGGHADSDFCFPEMARRVGCAVEPPPELVKNRESLAYWESCLTTLSHVNDQHFPDAMLLDVWRLLFHFIDKPRIALHDDFPSGEANEEGDSCVTWSRDMSGSRVHAEWWANTGRLWSAAPPATQMWLAPLVLEAIYLAAAPAVQELGTGKDLDIKELFSRDAGVLREIAATAVRGFPLELTERTLEANAVASACGAAWFIQKLQAE